MFFLTRVYYLYNVHNIIKYMITQKYSIEQLSLLTFRLSSFLNSFLLNFINKSSFLTIFYKRNELIWNDGLLVDFLQKKSADLYIRKFVIFTGFIFSERFIFEIVIKLYLDNLI